MKIVRRVTPAWPALVVWALATTALSLVARAEGYRPLHPVTWARWDSYLYLGIMRHGYTLVHCHPPDRRLWCGNAGWFPGYPWLIDAFHRVGAPLMQTAVAVSWILSLATLVLLWCAFPRARPAAAWGALVYAAFAPGRVYDYALFPLSMLTVATLVHFWAVHRGRWLVAGLAGAVAALSYPVGVVLAATSGIWILTGRSEPVSTRLRRSAFVSGLTCAGAGLVLFVQWLEVGRWDAYFVVQSKYGSALQEPLVPTERAIRTIAHSSPFHTVNAPAVQTLLVTVVVASVVIELLLKRNQVSRLDLLVALWAIGTWVATQSAAHVSVYRGEASLLPLALLIRRLPTPLIYAFAAVAAWVAIPMTQLFLRSILL